MKKQTYTPALISEIVACAWADDVSFDSIHQSMGVTEKEVITLMRTTLKPGSFRIWRARVHGRKAKHAIFSTSEKKSPARPV